MAPSIGACASSATQRPAKPTSSVVPSPTAGPRSGARSRNAALQQRREVVPHARGLDGPSELNGLSGEDLAEYQRLLEENSKLKRALSSKITSARQTAAALSQVARPGDGGSSAATAKAPASTAAPAAPAPKPQPRAASPAAVPAPAPAKEQSRFNLRDLTSSVSTAATAGRTAAAASVSRGAPGGSVSRSNFNVVMAGRVGDEVSATTRAAGAATAASSAGAARGPATSPAAVADALPINSKDYVREVATLSAQLDEHDDDDRELSLGGGSGPKKPPQVKSALKKAATRLDDDVPPPEAPEPRPDPPLSLAEQARREARDLVATHSPSKAVEDRHHWMVVTVPEKPVAGEDCVVYFNRNQSEPLRTRPRILMQYGFNHWELSPEGSNQVELQPSEITRDQGADFWSCRVKVPQNSFELNFIFTDGQNVWENNSAQDFTYAVEAGITFDYWIDTAGERLAAAEAKRIAAEKAAAEEAERQRQQMLAKQDVEKGREKANDLRNNIGNLQAGGSTSLLQRPDDPSSPLVWRLVPSSVKAGSKCKIQYNLAASPLARHNVPPQQDLTLLYGYNGWKSGGKVPMKRVPKALPVAKAGEAEAAAPAVVDPADWFEAELDVPFEATAINFVVNVYEHYDNNGSKDYKALVDLPAGFSSVDLWSEQLAEVFRRQEFETRIAHENAEKAKEARRMEKKKRVQEIVKAVERRKVRHVLYTEPEVVEAGQEVTIYYNPSDTSLAGRSRIWVMGGWNRWKHPRPFGPIEMTPPEIGSHFSAVVKVPVDAYKMDFVFSDVESGAGTYDNRGGYDYHLPVEGSLAREPALYVAHIAVEMAPIAKVGGLGDVVTALGRAVKEQGHNVEVLLPKYEFFNHSPLLKDQLKFETEFDWGGTRVFVTTAIVENLRCFFIEPRNGFFQTQTVYGRYDDEVRFDFFCKAALEFLLRTNRQPDILHCHDWSSAHVAKSYWEDYHPYGLWKPKVIFTIHNLNYGQKKISEAAYFCQKFTTVSPTYAFEIGGNPVISANTHKFLGIRNGIDPELWSPEENQWLPMSFTAENVNEGKAAARRALREKLGLTTWNDKFIVGVVSRLTSQKGTHLIKHTAFRATERGGQFVLLGSAPDPKVQGEFNALAQQMNGQDTSFCFKYDEPLSHLIYAACDMIVVPSMFEPCGLTQMIAMRYGAVPIVRHTGGLRDTVFDVDFDKARAAWDIYGSSDWQRDGLDATNGFAFDGTDPGALDYALNRAIDAWYNDKPWFRSLQQRVMEQDWSWARPAIDYIELYYAATKA